MKQNPQPQFSASWFVNGRIKLRQIQLLAEISRHETLQDAADAIGISQPAASKQLSDLESLMGISLFDREGRRLVRNLYGEIMTRRALTVMAELESAGEEYNALIQGRAGRVAIGAIDAPKITILAAAVAELQTEHPLIDLDILSGSSGTLFDLLNAGEIEIMLGRPPDFADPARFLYLDIAREGLAFIAGPQHPLKGRSTIPLKHIAAYPWVLQRKGSSLRQGVERLLHEHNLPMPTRVLNTDSVLMTLSYLARSDAVAVVSQPVAQLQAEFGQVAILDTAYEASISSYGILVPRNRPLPPAAATVMEILRRHAHV